MKQDVYGKIPKNLQRKSALAAGHPRLSAFSHVMPLKTLILSKHNPHTP